MVWSRRSWSTGLIVFPDPYGNLKNTVDGEFRPRNVSLVSVTENLDTATPQGQLFFNMLGSFAEFERDLITLRLLEGRRRKASNGLKSQGAILGYDYKDRRLIQNPKEATAVRDIFRLYLRLKSLSKVKSQLDAQGRVNKRGRPFSPQSIQYVLRNRTYIGWTKFKDIAVQGKHEPIVSRSIFGRVQKLLERNRKRSW